ncbi:MAG: hypothetical protein IKW59_05360 [Clostridia bacterium]|nr:hypothetical protein [Clostridia bacterium]
MITVGICESDFKITQLANHFFAHHGFICNNTICDSDADFIFDSLKKGTHYDILIENKTLNTPVKANYIHLLNSDDVTLTPCTSKCIFITYGLNSFATVTASSIHYDDNCLKFQYCLQRNIVNLKGAIIECQEFPVCIYNSSSVIHSALAFTTLALIAGFNPPLLKDIKI